MTKLPNDFGLTLIGTKIAKMLLEAKEPLTPSAIKSGIAHVHSTHYKVLTQWEAYGLVCRTLRPATNRCKPRHYYELTAEGRLKFQAVIGKTPAVAVSKPASSLREGDNVYAAPANKGYTVCAVVPPNLYLEELYYIVRSHTEGALRILPATKLESGDYRTKAAIQRANLTKLTDDELRALRKLLTRYLQGLEAT